MTDHRVPFQCSTSVSNLQLDPCWTPTAQTSDVESADAPKRMSRADRGWGLSEMVQRWPSHASMRPRSSKLSFRRTPTARCLAARGGNPEEGVEVGACVRRGHGGPGLAVKVCSQRQGGVLVAAGRVREEVANRPDVVRRGCGHGSETVVTRAKERAAHDLPAGRARRE